MRPPSKHGLERKYKPWRKGKSDKKKVVGTDKQRTNTSLKNRLRGQKRLLSKLQKQTDTTNGTDDKDKKEDKEETINGVKLSIKQLERDIATYEAKEREKKNAAK